MAGNEVLTVWIDGPLHGSRCTWARTDVEESLGQEIVCDVPRVGSSAIDQVDSAIDDERVELRFVGIVPKRIRKRTGDPQEMLRPNQFSLRTFLPSPRNKAKGRAS